MGGIADTLEGTGYAGTRVYGNGQTIVNDGQVDWFLSGGGWDDKKIVGNVGVTVYEGVINASMGASYGASVVDILSLEIQIIASMVGTSLVLHELVLMAFLVVSQTMGHYLEMLVYSSIYETMTVNSSCRVIRISQVDDHMDKTRIWGHLQTIRLR